MQPRYVEILADALKIEPSATDYLGDVDAGFYCTEYVRAWAFEAQLKRLLPREVRLDVVHAARARVAPPRPVVGGTAPDADELLKDVTGAEIELEAVAEYVRDALAAA